jgi:hypothetical protein
MRIWNRTFPLHSELPVPVPAHSVAAAAAAAADETETPRAGAIPPQITRCILRLLFVLNSDNSDQEERLCKSKMKKKFK